MFSLETSTHSEPDVFGVFLRCLWEGMSEGETEDAIRLIIWRTMANVLFIPWIWSSVRVWSRFETLDNIRYLQRQAQRIGRVVRFYRFRRPRAAPQSFDFPAAPPSPGRNSWFLRSTGRSSSSPSTFSYQAVARECIRGLLRSLSVPAGGHCY